MKQWLTLALALVALGAFTDLSVAQQKDKQKSPATSGETKPAPSREAGSGMATGKVMRVNPKDKTFTIMANGKEVTFSAKEMKTLPAVGDVIDVTYNQPAPGGPLVAAPDCCTKGSKSNSSFRVADQGAGIAQPKAKETKQDTVTPMRAPASMRGSVVDGIVHCSGRGSTCAVFRLVNAKRLSPFHDAELEGYTNRVNAILDELSAKNNDASHELRFILTPYAPFLVWCRSDATMEVPKGAITPEDNPSRFYQALGISASLDSYRPKATRHWVGTNYGVACYQGGKSQEVGRLLNAASLSPAHDRVLEDYTNRINSILDQAAKSRKGLKLQLSLLVTPRGLFLAWSEDDDTGGPLPKGAITADDDEEKVLQALGIEPGPRKGER